MTQHDTTGEESSDRDEISPHWDQQRCPDCGRFCGVSVEWRGPSVVEVASCVSCGHNPPECSHEDGTVSGCNANATHYGAFEEHRRESHWCAEHAPDDAEVHPYAREEVDS